MPSKQEAVVRAVENALQSHPAKISREEVLPQECPSEGLINILADDPVEAGYQLGAGLREWQRNIELELVVYSEDETTLNDLLDASVRRAAELLLSADYGDLISYSLIGPPEGADDIPMANAVYLRGASIGVTLFYETSENPMEMHT